MKITLTWQQLMRNKPKTDTEAVLLQSIAILSAQPAYEHMTPWEIFGEIKEKTEKVPWRDGS